MGLFKLPISSSKESNNKKDWRIPTAIEFTPESEEQLANNYYDDDTRITTMSEEHEEEMTGQGVNSRASVVNNFSHKLADKNTQKRFESGTSGYRENGITGMVGIGMNSRKLIKSQILKEGSKSNPFLADEIDEVQCKAYPVSSHAKYDSENEIRRRTTTTLNSSSRSPSKHLSSNSPKIKSGNLNTSSSGNEDQNFDEIMQSYEEKLQRFDNEKFLSFGDSEVDTEGEGSMLSGIEEENSAEWRRSKSSGGQKKRFDFQKMLRKKENEKPTSPSDSKDPKHITEGVNSREYDSYYHDGQEEGYISGEFDAEYDNAEAVRTIDNLFINAPIGVPNGKGSELTHRQLEDELYLYKLETLDLTDACRELADQLDEAERKLESVQAQATFRIHALETELQDGHIGMKSLVKMTSTEMDGRLEALRALGKTTSIQAEKIKERDMELNRLDSRLRKILRDSKLLKRENQKIRDERVYLRQRLDDLEEGRIQLERNYAKLIEETQGKRNSLPLEGKEKMDVIKNKLNETLEQVGYLKSQIEYKDKEIENYKAICERNETEIEKLRENLAMKEHDVVRVELQLDRVRKDLVEAASTAKISEDARLIAENKEVSSRHELEKALCSLDDTTTKLMLLQNNEAEMKKLISTKSISKDDANTIEEQRKRLTELEIKVASLKEEKEDAFQALSASIKSNESIIAKCQTEIDSLNRDVELHAEQMLLAQAMLDEKEEFIANLRAQLEESKSEFSVITTQMEDDLAAKSRKVLNLSTELEVKVKDISRLEETLEKVRSEFSQHHSNSKAHGDDKQSSELPKMESASIEKCVLAGKDGRIERLERELGACKRELDAAKVELDLREKASERLKTEIERIRSEKCARIDELESILEEKRKSMDSFRKELDEKKQELMQMEDNLQDVQSNLDNAKLIAEKAESAQKEAITNLEESKSAEQSLKHSCEKLKTQVDLLQRAKEELHSELVALKIEWNNQQQSNTHAAASLAATNAARQAEMEMQVEKLQKEIDVKKREIETIKSELHEKDQTSTRLYTELQDAKNELVHYKERIDSEKEQHALQLIANREYFDDDRSITSEHTLNGGHRRSMFSLFSRSKINNDESEKSLELEVKDHRNKDILIEQLENTIAENMLAIANLKKELVATSSKFNKDESQRRLLIQRLEHENQAYSIKLGILENEFNELKKKRDMFTLDAGIDKVKSKDYSFGQSFFTNASDASIDSESNSSLSGVSSVSGASRLTPLEQDNLKLKKQRHLYQNRIKSLQAQLSEIQQIVPELMSKSKSQINKLESTIQNLKEEAADKENSLKDDIAELKRQNEQLQAATRSRLQASNVEWQDEIDQLKMRLEAREATIAQLEMLTSKKKRGSGNSSKKNLKNEERNAESSVFSGLGSSDGGSVSK